MRNYKRPLLLVLTSIINSVTFAQATSPTTKPVDTGFMVSQGKIYVVMVIVITILAGLIAYVSRLDRKITKFEKGEGL